MKVWLGRGRRVITAKPWVSAVVVIALLGGGVAGYLLTGRSTAAASTVQVTTRLVSATTGTVKQSVSTTGTLTPADEHDVSFSSSAEITSVRVSQGQKVAKGQVLGTIATLSLTSALASAKASLATAEATLSSAEDDSTTTSAQLTADKAAVSSAKGGVTDARTALAAATLRSPISGTVAAVNVTKGDQSSGSSGSSSSSGSTSGSGTGTTGGSAGSGSGSGSGSSGSRGGTTGGSGSTGTSTGTSTSSSSSSSGDFVVVGMKTWQASASVDDTEVGLIAKGDQAQLTTTNVTGTVFGTVSSVSVLSSSSSGSASYPVVIAVTGSPAGLHDGAPATITIVYKQVSNVLTVPTTAIHRAAGGSYVLISKSGKQVHQTVTTGVSSGGTTQITSGLRSGQQVYVQVVTRTGTGTSGSTTQRQGRTGNYPGGGTGNYPGGGTGNFPGRGAGNFPGAGAGGFGANGGG
jgi:multidrug efflux pump subunit AcrA (membrane-fusion protein)